MVFGLGSGGNKPSTPDFIFQQVAESKNLSQLVRSNAPIFWDYSRQAKNLKQLAEYTRHEGLISGDAHIGNYSVIPVKTKDGRQALRYLNIDFDDAGRGPFALEFANFVAMAKAASKDLKVQEMVHAYILGLRGERLPVPKLISRAEHLPFKDYETLRQAYVDRKHDGKKFKYKAGEIEAWNGSITAQDIAPLFKGAKILDIARRPLERGGSVDSLRLWVLVREPAGTTRIFELKEYQDTALSYYRRQADAPERVQELQDLYWRGVDPSSYSLVNVKAMTFWLREKKVEVLTYEKSSQENEARLYVANLIGQTQGRQNEGPAYLAKILEDRNGFKEAVKDFVHGYLDLAKENMNKP